jgi:hypothetical protein
LSDSSNSSSGGIGFLGLLAVLFIALKLTHVIDWNWVYILMPIWAPVAFVLLVALCFLVAFVISSLKSKAPAK